MKRYYIDSSALVKLVLREAESAALTETVDGQFLISSPLLLVETRRAVLRGGDAEDKQSLEKALRGVDVARLTVDVAAAAGQIAPPALRTLDAIHLATALSLPPLDGFICYDARLSQAAANAGLTVVSPA